VITVDVVTKKQSGSKHLVQKVMFDGADILWIDDSDIFGIPNSAAGRREISIKQFEQQLAADMIVPSRLLKVTYSFDLSSKPKLLFPDGATTRKH